MWFKKKKEIIDVENEAKLRYEEMLSKFPKGVYSFLGQEVYLFDYSNPNDYGDYYFLPNLRIEWFDNNKNLCTSIVNCLNPFLIKKEV